MTSLRTTIPSLQHHDRCQNALLRSRFGTSQVILSRKKLNRLLRTAHTPSFRSNATVGFEAETSTGRISFYELLEVPREVSFEEVKRAYRRLALRYHPDVSSPHLAEENARKFIEIQEAYRTLSDPMSGEVYDRELHLGLVSTSTSARWPHNEEVYDSSGWKRQWQDQLEKLNRRSMARELYSKVNSGLFWGAKMSR